MGERVLSKINDFYECLEYSHQAEDLPFWGEVYCKAFPNVTAIISHREDGWWQRLGIDRSVVLSDSRRILVDEKVRKKDYGDIALEYISRDTDNAPGWVCKPLIADYIAYAVAPKGICYLLPVIQLQLAWVKNGKQWIAKHKEVKAPNKNYNTISCGVPVAELFKAIGKELRINFTPFLGAS